MTREFATPEDHLRWLVAQIALLSHASTSAYDGERGGGTDEDIGGKRPPGGDVDRPRRPREGASDETWDAFRDEYASWLVCYQRRTPDYFRRELARRRPVVVLVREAEEALHAWTHSPVPADPPRGHPLWAVFVANSPLDAGKLATKYGVSRQRIYQLRKQYRKDAA